jgi:hypothetical protein
MPTSRACLRSSQGIEVNRAGGLCPENVKSFYYNLLTLYNLHNYGLEKIWNYDEFGTHAGRIRRRALVFTKHDSREMHSIILD